MLNLQCCSAAVRFVTTHVALLKVVVLGHSPQPVATIAYCNFEHIVVTGLQLKISCTDLTTSLEYSTNGIWLAAEMYNLISLGCCRQDSVVIDDNNIIITHSVYTHTNM